MPDDVASTEVPPSELGRVTTLLSTVDSADLERFEPPADLWSRIAASVAAEPERVADGAGTVVEYAIDAHDRVIDTGGEWSAFASDNGAPELGDMTADRTLWSYFGSDEVRDLWRLLVAQVRTTGLAATVPLRCDAPGVRRWFDMTLTPQRDGVVQFRSTLAFEEHRPEVAFLVDRAERDDRPAVPVCSWCGDGHDGSTWRRIEDIVSELRLLEDALPAIDYGICASCRDRMASELHSSAEAGTAAPGRS